MSHSIGRAHGPRKSNAAKFAACLLRNSRLPALLLSLAVTGIGEGSSHAQETKAVATWNQFLGPNRNGISDELKLVRSLEESTLKELWRAPGGTGMSGLAIDQKNVITLVQRDDKQVLLALDRLTGKMAWEADVAAAYANSMGDGPRATPAISGGKVFAFTGDGTLAAVDAATGKMLWKKSVVEELDAKIAEYGMASSPLVWKDQVIVTVGATKATIVAYDASGKILWSSGSDPAGYSSPTLLSINGEPQVVAFTGASAVGVDPSTGKQLWRYPFETNYECNIATPIAIGDNVFISAGENHGSVLLNLKAKGESYEASEVWTSLGSKSTLRSEWQTAIVDGGYIYGFDNVGAAGPVSHLTCIDAKTGERVWQKLRFGKGNLIAADGKLWISTMEGELVLVEINPKQYVELGRVAVLGETRQAPALSQGLLYLRDSEQIVCVDVRSK